MFSVMVLELLRCDWGTMLRLCLAPYNNSQLFCCCRKQLEQRLAARSNYLSEKDVPAISILLPPQQHPLENERRQN
eukprot:2468645-Amphidinium_carterae.1